MKIEKIDILISSLLFVVSLSFYLHYSTPILWSPDEMNYFLASQKFIEHGNININNPLNEKYNTSVFNYGFTVFKNRFEQYPTVFCGSVLLYSIIMVIFGEGSFFWVSPTFGAIGVVVMYYITRELFKSRKLGIFAALVLFTMPIWIRWSTEHYNNIPTTVFFLLSFLSLIILKKDMKFFMSGLFLSISILLRITSLLYMLPFLLYFYLESAKKRQFLVFLLPIGFTLLLVIPFLKIIMFGSPFFQPHDYVFNYPGFEDQTHSSVSILQQFAFSDADRNILIHAIYYFFTKNFMFLFLPYSFIGLILLFKQKKNITLFIFSLMIVLLLFHGRGWGGFEKIDTLQSSFLRYILPIYGLLPISFAFLIGMFEKISGKKYIISVFAIIIISTLSYTIFYPYYGLNSFEKYRNDHILIKNETDNIIEPDSIIITDLITLVSSISHHRNIIYYPDIPKPIRQNEIEKVVEMALKDHKKVYFTGGMYKGSNITKENRIILKSLSNKYKISKLSEFHYIEIYKINFFEYDLCHPFKWKSPCISKNWT